MIVTVENLKSLPVPNYFAFCNALYVYGRVRAIPTLDSFDTIIINFVMNILFLNFSCDPTN